MTLATKITGLLTSLTRNQLAAMTPAQRQQLADECERVRRMADLTDAIKPAPKAAFFAELSDGRGRQ